MALCSCHHCPLGRVRDIPCGPLLPPSIPPAMVPSGHGAPWLQPGTGSRDTLQLAQPGCGALPGLAPGHSRGWPAPQVPGEVGGESRVCHAPAPNWPSRPGQPRGNPEGARGLPVGATAWHREQGRQRDAPRLGTASEQALCSRGWMQVAVMSCCQNVSPSWDSEGCHLGTSPAPCSPQHSVALSCLMLPQDEVWGVHWWGAISSPTSIGVLCPWGPPAQLSSSLQGDHPAV